VIRRSGIAALLALIPGLAVAQQPSAGAGPPPAEIEATAGYEHLSAGLPAWRSASLHVDGPREPWGTAYGEVAATDRFARQDVQIVAGGVLRLGSVWALSAEGSLSPSHEVLPTWTAGVEAARVLGSGWVVRGGLRRTEYTAATTTLGTITLERYWAGFRAAYTLYGAKLSGASLAVAHRLGLDRYWGADERSRVGAWFAWGEEVESQGAQVLRLSTRSVAVSARYWITPQWALVADASWTRQGDAYSRVGTRAGLRRRL
jgi:YaiO family outer membrane protein